MTDLNAAKTRERPRLELTFKSGGLKAGHSIAGTGQAWCDCGWRSQTYRGSYMLALGQAHDEWWTHAYDCTRAQTTSSEV